MTDETVAIIGAGPAGLFAARELANNGIKVVLFNRDIKPGGLVEYGIYPEKFRIKDGLRSQFKAILECERVSYFGNVAIGQGHPLKLEDLRRMGFAAVLVACGAQGTKWLGLPGEEFAGVYHAKTIVYHYNHLPPYSTQELQIGKKVFVIGVGNVMTDIVRYLVGLPQVEEINTIARRGPAEVKFDKRELEPVAAYLDTEAFERELQRVTPAMQAIGQDPEEATKKIREVLSGVEEKKTRPTWRMQFLYSPSALLSSDGRNITGLRMEENILEPRNGDTRARGTGKMVEVATDTVIFAIGDSVSDELDIPIKGNAYTLSLSPRHPVDGNSYELTDEDAPGRLEGMFVTGWARYASAGMVGIARKEGASAARAIMEYLQTNRSTGPMPAGGIPASLKNAGYTPVALQDLAKLEDAEKKQALEKGLPEFKFDTNEDMLKAMGMF